MDRIINLCKQYRYGILILLVGIALMLIPGKETAGDTPIPTSVSQEASLEEKLSQILSRMEGVGKTEVLLTIAEGGETIYEVSLDQSSAQDTDRIQKEPVILSGNDRVEQGLIRQEYPPIYQGAVVVCQGGDRAAVKLRVVEAVSDATGLTADKITVVKMK